MMIMFTPYSLRHTHTSYLLSKGIPIEYISKRLGHATISQTLDTYSHLLEEHKKEQGQRVRELFSWHIFDTYSLETLSHQGLYTETEGFEPSRRSRDLHP